MPEGPDARGWTRPGGRPHAEAMAFAQAGAAARGATLYVTLEPCAHRSERGPACADLAVEAGLARVIAGVEDPDPRTAGQGLERLRASGSRSGLCRGCRQRRKPCRLSQRQDIRPPARHAQAGDGRRRLRRAQGRHAASGSPARPRAPTSTASARAPTRSWSAAVRCASTGHRSTCGCPGSKSGAPSGSCSRAPRRPRAGRRSAVRLRLPATAGNTSWSKGAPRPARRSLPRASSIGCCSIARRRLSATAYPRSASPAPSACRQAGISQTAAGLAATRSKSTARSNRRGPHVHRHSHRHRHHLQRRAARRLARARRLPVRSRRHCHRRLDRLLGRVPDGGRPRRRAGERVVRGRRLGRDREPHPRTACGTPGSG